MYNEEKNNENKPKRKRGRKRKGGSGSAHYDKKMKRWYVQYRYEDWKGDLIKSTKRGDFKTKGAAEEWLDDFLDKKQADLGIQFKNFVEIYNEDMAKRLRASTVSTKKYITDDKLLPYFGEVPMSDITTVMIRKWQSTILDKGYKETYIRTIYNQLNAIFNYAVRYYDLKTNPCRKAGTIGRNKADEMLFWTHSEFIQFSEAIIDKRPSYIGFKVLYWTGVRIGELLALSISNIDFEKKTLTIKESFQRLNINNSVKDIITEPKTDRGKRIISLPDFLVKDLQDYVDSMYGIQEHDRLFPFTKSYFEVEMKRGVKLSGVKKIRIHDLRHSHIAHLIELNFPPLEIAERTGHDVKTLLSVYAHLYPNKQSKMAEKLNEEYRKEHDDAGDEQKPKT